MTKIEKIELESYENVFYELFLETLNSSQDWKVILSKISDWEQLTEIEEYFLVWIINSFKKDFPFISVISDDMILSILLWLKDYINVYENSTENIKKFISSLLCTAFLLDTKHI